MLKEARGGKKGNFDQSGSKVKSLSGGKQEENVVKTEHSVGGRHKTGGEGERVRLDQLSGRTTKKYIQLKNQTHPTKHATNQTGIHGAVPPQKTYTGALRAIPGKLM